jgi:type IX secretion system PorP/SprF family membrane protein
MKRRSTKSLLLLLILAAGQVAAQDIHFSQFFETPLLRNPGLAGIFTGDYRVQMVYRDQWRSVTDGYKTGSLNGEFKLPIGKADDFVTVGGQVLYDRAGSAALTTVSLLPALNYHKSLSQSRNQYLSLGFMGGVVNRHFDRSKITTDNTYNNGQDGETIVMPNYTYLDGSVGMSFSSNLSDNPADNFYLGLAYHHFANPRNSFFRDPAVQLDPKWVASAGFRFGVSEYSYFTILGDYSKQASYQEACVGTLFGMKIGPEIDHPQYVLHGGLFIRWQDALIPVVKLDYSGFSFALSYDVNISRLRPASLGRGGFELSVSYIGLLNRASRSTQNSTLCPRF